MTETSTVENKSSFWSPGTIFLICVALTLLNPLWGVIAGFAFISINSLKMRATRKFGIYVLVSVICLSLLDWISPNEQAIRLLNSNWGLWPYVTFFIAAEAIVLGIIFISKKDIKVFELNNTGFVQSSWWHGVLTVLIIFMGYSGALFGLEYAYKSAGYCHRSNLYGIILENSRPERIGLAQVLLERDDMGCAWTWNYETFFPSKNSEGALENIAGGLDGNYDKYSVDFYQSAWRYDKVAPETFEKLNIINLEGDKFDARLSRPPHVYITKAICYNNGGQKTCAVFLGYTHIVYRLDVLVADYNGLDVVSAPDDVVYEIINRAIAKVDERIYQYEMTLP